MSYVNVLRVPDEVTVILQEETFGLRRADDQGCWQERDITVLTTPGRQDLRIVVSSPSQALKKIHLRWRVVVPTGLRFLGDHWERAYGDLEWKAMVPDRVMPWYFLTYDGENTHGYGVKTGAKSMCSWSADPAGLSLWLDVRSGGVGVELGQRELEAAIVVTRQGSPGESPFQAAQTFCRCMCDHPLMPAEPIYGGNNWYYTYGQSSHDQILEDTRLITSLAPDGGNRPFMVIDDGWQASYAPPFNGGPWHAGNHKFPDMPALASTIKNMGARPGIWIRPLWTAEKYPEWWFLKTKRFGEALSPLPLDPSVPEVLEHVAADIKRLVEWGYELIKHDFTTFDICGLWGLDMTSEVTPDGWSFANHNKTTAEIIIELYRTIRKAAGEAVVISCNTFGHLAAGLTELQRIGDDTSGREWQRTRRMGINTLAFRGAQHGAFFAVDADCVGLTKRIPWKMNRQWLELLARSGTPLFVSAEPEAIGPPQAEALKKAFVDASQKHSLAEPLDWLESTSPSRWRLDGQTVCFDWFGQ